MSAFPPFTLNAWLRYDLIERTLAGLDGIESVLEIGAGRGALARQLTIESLLLSITGGVIGILIARWMVGAFVVLRREGARRSDVGREHECDTRVNESSTGHAISL